MLPEFITGELLLNGGAVSVLTAVVWMIYTGRLVSRKVVDDIREDKNERLAEMRGIMDNLQKAYLTSEQDRREQSGQITQLLTTSRIAEALLRALPHPEQNQGQEPRELP